MQWPGDDVNGIHLPGWVSNDNPENRRSSPGDRSLPFQSASPDDIASVQVWQQEQENAKHLSPLSWRIIAKGPGHMVPLDRPDLVISQLVSLVNDVRNGDVPNSGTTLTK
jgi:hypothetical protein